MQEKHLIVKKYLEEHSLVESNIISFNNFIEKRIQEIVSEISETIVNEEFEITLGKKKDGQIDSDDVEIGRIPIMVGSKVCNTYGMSKDDLIKNFNDPLDPKGYFIINGNERVMIMSEDLAENQPFIEDNSKGNLHLRIFSSRGTYRIPTTISESKDGLIEVSFSRFRDLPAVVVLKALGMTKESEMARYIGKETDSVIVNLYEFSNISNSEDAMLHIAEKTALQGTKKEILDRVKNRIDSYLFPHIGQKNKNQFY